LVGQEWTIRTETGTRWGFWESHNQAPGGGGKFWGRLKRGKSFLRESKERVESLLGVKSGSTVQEKY